MNLFKETRRKINQINKDKTEKADTRSRAEKIKLAREEKAKKLHEERMAILFQKWDELEINKILLELKDEFWPDLEIKFGQEIKAMPFGIALNYVEGSVYKKDAAHGRKKFEIAIRREGNLYNGDLEIYLGLNETIKGYGTKLSLDSVSNSLELSEIISNLIVKKIKYSDDFI